MQYRGIGVRQAAPPEIKSFILDKFLGVDFTQGEFITDSRRSPDAKNTIWGTNPYSFDTRTGKKRLLQERLSETISTGIPVYGIFVYEPLKEILFHAGTNLYRLVTSDITKDEGEAQLILSGLTETHSTSFMFNGKLFILGCGVYLMYDGITVTKVAGAKTLDDNKAFIPTTVIGRSPSGGGTVLEAVNLLSIWRTNSFFAQHLPAKHIDEFAGDGSTTEYTLTITENITYDDITIKVNGSALSLVEDVTLDRINGKITFLDAPALDAEILVTYYTEDIENPEWVKDYKLDSESIDYKPLKVVVNGEELTEGEDYTVDRESGIVSFIDAPTAQIGGVDSVIITFAKSQGEDNYIEDIFDGDGVTTEFSLSFEVAKNDITVFIDDMLTTAYTANFLDGKIIFDAAPSEYAEITVKYYSRTDTRADAINKCSIFGIFGGANDTRVFLSGNPDYKNKDWHSGLYDATYFPDNGFNYIGTDNTAIMGYVKQYDTQMIVKESSQQDSSVFLRTFGVDGAGNPVFPVEQGAVGIGAVSKNCFAYLQGIPLFLASQGVVGVIGTNVDYQRLIQDQSTLINSVLTYERDLFNAVGIEYENKYYLFINGKVFVCDARMRYTDALGNPQYEWQYWDGISASAAAVCGNYLIFGYEGMLWRLRRTDETNAYIDQEYDGSEHDIESYWTTPKLYLGSISVKKKFRDVYILFGRRETIRCNIEAVVDNYRFINLGQFKRVRLLDFSDINFNDISFETQHTNYTLKERVMLERFDNISFKFSKLIESEPTNAAFAIDLFQITYNFNH
jgi:hypothetical protein